MQEGNFKLQEPGNYTVELFEPNNFLNDKNSPADLAKFGKTYSVKFKGDAETFLWTTKTEPVEDKSYYGHIQETSGKMLRFKVDKLPDGNFSTGPATSNTPDYEPGTNVRWAIGMAYRAHLQVTGTPDDEQGEFPFDSVKLHALGLLRMFDELKAGSLGDKPAIKEVGPSQPNPSQDRLSPFPQLASDKSLGDTYRERKVQTEDDLGEPDA